jgi:flagellar hook protein FlgE
MSLIGTMSSGVSALRTFTKGLEVIGNNIANVNTTGYKSSSAQYSDSFSNVLQRSAPSTGASGTNTTTIEVGTGVKLAGIATNFSQGSLSATGSATDLGVSGNGFFRVRNSLNDQEFVTRAGNFRWDDQGYLTTQEGFRVQGLTGGAIGDIQLSTPPTGTQLQSFTIDRAGSLVEFYSDGTSATNNQILLQDFQNPAALKKEGNNLYSAMESAGPIGSATLATDGSNAPGTNGLGAIQSGVLELSNVDLTDQFAELITTQRSFQAGSRLITISDTVLEDIVNLKR